MKQRRLLKTIEIATSKSFSTDKELLTESVLQLVENDEIQITGGRIWQLHIASKSYRLIYQTGNVQKIDDEFKILLDDYPQYEKLTEERTILADETDQTLIDKGIFRYSASGVGSKVKVSGVNYYEYFVAVNSDVIDDDLKYSLNIIATVLTSKLKERKLSRSQKYLREDLDKAKQLQRSILPEHELFFDKYEIFGVTIPAQTLGGDFYDYVKIGNDESRIGVVVGDAASKGLAAAAEAMYISGAIRMACTFQIKISPLMSRLNNLVNKIFSDDRFTTLFYGEISDDKRGLFLYANAGHNPPIFYRNSTEEIFYLESTGPLLGPAPSARYETDSINFRDGDILVIYSDGIVESADEEFEQYGEENLEKVIKNNSNLSSKEIVYKILDEVNKFSTSKSLYQDDKTVVVIKRKEEK